MQKYSRLINPPMIFSTEPNQIQHSNASKDKSANNNQLKKLPLESSPPRNFHPNLKLRHFSKRSEGSFASARNFRPNKCQKRISSFSRFDKFQFCGIPSRARFSTRAHWLVASSEPTIEPSSLQAEISSPFSAAESSSHFFRDAFC